MGKTKVTKPEDRLHEDGLHEVTLARKFPWRGIIYKPGPPILVNDDLLEAMKAEGVLDDGQPSS